jgi:hypothetical protein
MPPLNRKSPDGRPVIRCLTIAAQDAVTLTITTEFAMPVRHLRRLDNGIKNPAAIGFETELLL